MPEMRDGERFKEEFHAASAQARATDVAFLTMVIDALEAGQFAKALQDLRYWRDAIRAMDSRSTVTVRRGRTIRDQSTGA